MLEEPLLRCAEGHIPPNVALMHLIFCHGSEGDFKKAISRAMEAARMIVSAQARERLEALFSLLSSHPDAFRVIKEVVGSAEQEDSSALATPESALAYWNSFYDRAVAISPEASVASYSLGDAGLLRQITAKIVANLQDWDVLSRDRNVLDFGCGIGRMEEALSGLCREIVGVDISSRMIEVASHRCAGLNNVRLLKIDGYDLSQFNTESFDVILVIDVLPGFTFYSSFVRQLLTRLSGILRRNGDLVILNYSSRADVANDQAEVGALADRLGLRCVRNGTRNIDQWDGATFHLKKP